MLSTGKLISILAKKKIDIQHMIKEGNASISPTLTSVVRVPEHSNGDHQYDYKGKRNSKVTFEMSFEASKQAMVELRRR